MKRLLKSLIAVYLSLGIGMAGAGSAGISSPSVNPSESKAIHRLQPVVEAEQSIYSYADPANGAGPMWCFGNTCIVRLGGTVFVSGLRKLPGYAPLNNIRWTLFRGTDDGWKEIVDGGDTHEREPCPLACFPDGQLFLSVNPNSSKPEEYDGPAQPRILQFDASDLSERFRTMVPPWNRGLAFHGHTYRSFSADGPHRELVLFYNTAYDRTYWTFFDRNGRWSSQGEIAFPWGAEYDKPQPVRICYPVVQLKNRAVHICGVSDIVEPYAAWKAFKKQLTGNEWDYDFRRLFYTWSDDISTGTFHDWVEVASRDKTCGWLFPCDLWINSSNHVFILWTERAIDERLRKQFFPEATQSIALNYAILHEGKIVQRNSVLQWNEGSPGEQPGRGRFHVTPDGRLWVLYYVSGRSASGQMVSENRLVEIKSDGSLAESVKVPLKQPLKDFLVAGPRAGCAPTMTIDLLSDSGRTLRYARILLR